MSEVAGDWMDQGGEAAKASEHQTAVEFAKLYLVFEQHPAAKALLQHWVAAVEQRDIAPSASHAEYAYWEGRRAFIRGIQRQIEFAHNEGRQPI